MMLKHDIALLGHLDNGLGFYRFSYNGTDKAYVGVMAQEVQTVVPEAVVRGGDGYLRVSYDRTRPTVPDLRSMGRFGRTCPGRGISSALTPARTQWRRNPPCRYGITIAA